MLENKVTNLENENAEMKNMMRTQFNCMQDQFRNFKRYILLKNTVGNFCRLIKEFLVFVICTLKIKVLVKIYINTLNINSYRKKNVLRMIRNCIQ